MGWSRIGHCQRERHRFILFGMERVSAIQLTKVLMVILFCSSCAKAGKARGHVENHGQSLVTVATLTALNEAQLNLRAAQELAFNPSPPSGSANDKITNMSKAFASGACEFSLSKQIDPPQHPLFTSKWDFIWYVGHAGKAVCPAVLEHSLDFTVEDQVAGKNHLAIVREFRVTASDFRKFNSFWYMATVGEAYLRGKNQPGGRSVEGQVNYELRFDGVGSAVLVGIRIQHTLLGGRAKGYATLNVRIGGAVSVASISWDDAIAGGANTIVLNNESMTEKEFQSLFSALGALELIDYAKNM